MLLPPTGTSFLSRDRCVVGGGRGVGHGHRIRLSMMSPGTICRSFRVFPLLPPRGPTVFSPSNHRIGLGAFCFGGSMGRAPEEMGSHQLPGDVTPGRDLVESACVSPTGTAVGMETSMAFGGCARGSDSEGTPAHRPLDGWPRRLRSQPPKVSTSFHRQDIPEDGTAGRGTGWWLLGVTSGERDRQREFPGRPWDCCVP